MATRGQHQSGEGHAPRVWAFGLELCVLLSLARSASSGEWIRADPAGVDHDLKGLPGAVLNPRDTADVVKIVKIAAKHAIPIIPFSGGTALEGSFRFFLSPVLSQVLNPLLVFSSRPNCSAYLRIGPERGAPARQVREGGEAHAR